MTKQAKDAVREAAFWDLAICLDCLETVERPLAADATCEGCGGTEVLPATLVQRCATLVADEEEGDNE